MTKQHETAAFEVKTEFRAVYSCRYVKRKNQWEKKKEKMETNGCEGVRTMNHHDF